MHNKDTDSRPWRESAASVTKVPYGRECPPEFNLFERLLGVKARNIRHINATCDVGVQLVWEGNEVVFKMAGPVRSTMQATEMVQRLINEVEIQWTEFKQGPIVCRADSI